MRVLVTGGGGFIGHHLVRRLIADGHEVRVLDNFSTGHRERLRELPVETVEGDLRSFERVHTAVRGIERVFHLGALPSVQRSIQDPLTTHAVNVDGTLNVLLASRDAGVERVVLASSSSVYGANPAIPKSEGDIPLPLSPYAVAKLAAEQYGRAFHSVYGLHVTSLRLFNVFGPGQSPFSEYAAVIPRFLAEMTEGRPPVIYGDGLQTRDFTYVEDVVDAFLLAAETAAAAGGVFNVAAGRQTSLLALVDVLSESLGQQVEPVHGPAREGEVRFSQGDSSLAIATMGWTPRWSVAKGLHECVAQWSGITALA
jgi:UDP-glucose 4-epimerase